MGMQKAFLTCICLCGTFLLTESWRPSQDKNALFKTLSRSHGIKAAAVHLDENNGEQSLYDSQNEFPAGENEEQLWDKKEQPEVESRRLQMRRGRRDLWGNWGQASTTEDDQKGLFGFGRPLLDWRRDENAKERNNWLMTFLKELFGEKESLLADRYLRRGDEDDEDDSDSDEDGDDDDEEEEEEEEVEGGAGGEGGQEGRKGKGGEAEGPSEAGEKGTHGGGEEEEDEEATEAPSNQTETYLNSYGCQVTDNEIRCSGLGMNELPVIHDPEPSLLDMSENDITVIAGENLAGLLNLESLNMSKNRLDDESFGPNSLPSLTLLKTLDLDSNHISKIPALPSSLEVLKLNNNKLTSLTLDSFKGLQKLVSLELQSNGLYEASLSPQTFRPLVGLVNLHLGGNLFRLVPQGLPASLQELDMGQNQLEQVTQERLEHCVKLRVLDLSHNRLHEQSVSHSLWATLSSLETLDLSYNQFTQVPPNLPRRLRKLSLQHNNIHHIPAFSFRHLRPGLQSLQLSNNDLSHSSLSRNAFAGTFVSLAELLLDNNRLSEVPQCIRLFKNLQVLRLDNNHIRMVKQWAVCHPQNSDSTLTSLHLENNLLQVEAISPKAFSCVSDTQGLVLYPQQV